MSLVLDTSQILPLKKNIPEKSYKPATRIIYREIYLLADHYVAYSVLTHRSRAIQIGRLARSSLSLRLTWWDPRPRRHLRDSTHRFKFTRRRPKRENVGERKLIPLLCSHHLRRRRAIRRGFPAEGCEAVVLCNSELRIEAGGWFCQFQRLEGRGISFPSSSHHSRRWRAIRCGFR
jgi:hypothetical protein